MVFWRNIEDKASWVSFFQWFRGPGLGGVKLVVDDKYLEMLEPWMKYSQKTNTNGVLSTFSVTFLLSRRVLGES